MNENNRIKVAVIDMNCGHPNQGMRGINEVLDRFAKKNNIDLSVSIYDIRQTSLAPDLSYDIYISSGGPGSPFDGEGKVWEDNFFALLDKIDQHNLEHNTKKYMFLICHSFQLACRKYQLGEVTKRKSTAFGIFPTSLTAEGVQDPIFQGISNPFFTVDSRDWQVVQPNTQQFDQKNATILAIEKERPHVNLERCIMSVRFSPYMVGTQFHPEADAIGMKMYLLQEEKKQAIITHHGLEKYQDMLESLDNPNRIRLTQQVILPNFLEIATQELLCSDKVNAS
jgi:GMP synthase-like glutamine amidotransferase